MILVTVAIEMNADEAEVAADEAVVVEADVQARVRENPKLVKTVNLRSLQSLTSHQNPLMMKVRSLAAPLLRESTSISLIILLSK